MYVCRDFAHGRPCYIHEKYFDPYDYPCMTCYYCDYYPDDYSEDSSEDGSVSDENIEGGDAQ